MDLLGYKVLLYFWFFFVALGSPAIAQVSGTVSSGGTPIPGVVLTLSDANGTTCLATSDVAGVYAFLNCDAMGEADCGEDCFYVVTIDESTVAATLTNRLAVGPLGGVARQVACNGMLDWMLEPIPKCEDPSLITPCFAFSDRASAFTMEGSIVTFPASASASNGGPGMGANTYQANYNETGSVGGLAYDQNRDLIYGGALAMRHADIGPGADGIVDTIDDYGGLYVIPGAGGGVATVIDIPNSNYQSAFNLTTPPNDAVNFPAGSPTLPRHVDTPALALIRPGLPGWALDSYVFDTPGKIGLGDVTMNADGTALYLVNLADRQLYRVDLTGLPGTTPSVANGAVTAIGPIAGPGCPNGEWRPWALEWHGGDLYVGGVCSAENGGTTADLSSHVYRFDDPDNSTAATLVLSTPLDYLRDPAGSAFVNPALWDPWQDDHDQAFETPLMDPLRMDLNQPMLTDIEFDVNGCMSLGYRDRTPDQYAVTAFVPNGPSTRPLDTVINEVYSGGDLRKACWIEGPAPMGTIQTTLNGTKPPAPVTTPSGYWLNEDGSVACPQNSRGGGIFEFYTLDSLRRHVNHRETSQGHIALLPGCAEVVSIAMDPWTVVNGGADERTGGVNFFSQVTGENIGGYRVFGPEPRNNGITARKGNGLGDLEFCCDPQDVQVGGLVWCDCDVDGLYEAYEGGRPGIDVFLFSNNTQIAMTTTDANGMWFFDVTPNLPYHVEFNTSLPLVPSDANMNMDDQRDSDGYLGGRPRIDFCSVEGRNKHDLGLGVICVPTAIPLVTNIAEVALGCVYSDTVGQLLVAPIEDFLAINEVTNGECNGTPITIDDVVTVTEIMVQSNCTTFFERIINFETNECCSFEYCDLTQRVNWTVDREPPKIVTTNPDRCLGCHDISICPVEDFVAGAAPLAADLASVEVQDGCGTNCAIDISLFCDTYTTNGCLITLERKIRVADCCGNVSVADIQYTINCDAPEIISIVETGGYLGCTNATAIPEPNWRDLVHNVATSAPYAACVDATDFALLDNSVILDDGAATLDNSSSIMAMADLLTDPGFDTANQTIGDTTQDISSHGPSNTWLITDDGTGGAGDQWRISAGGLLLSQAASSEAQAALQWVSHPACTQASSTGTLCFELDWNQNGSTITDEIDLQLFVVGWDTGPAPQMDVQNSNVDNAAGGDDHFDLNSGTRLDGQTGDAPIILVNDNTSTFPGLTEGAGPEKFSIPLSLINGVTTGFNFYAVAFYGEARGGADFLIDNVQLSFDDPTIDPACTIVTGCFETVLAPKCADYTAWTHVEANHNIPDGTRVTYTISDGMSTIMTNVTGPSIGTLIDISAFTTNATAITITGCLHGVINSPVPRVDSLCAASICPIGVGTSVVDVAITNNIACEVSVTRTYSVTGCCDQVATRSVTWTYNREPDLTVGPLAKLDLGCIASVNQIPPVDLTMLAATSDCSIVSIQKLDQSAPMLDANGCTWSNERVFVVETLCGVTNLVTQSVCWVLNNSRPEILATAKDAEHFGCATNVPRTLAESFAALEIVNATQTQLVSEVFMNQGCDVMVVRTWRVEDCCGNFDRATESFLYTPASELLADATINPTVDVGCVTSLNLIPKSPMLTMQASGNVFCYTTTNRFFDERLLTRSDPRGLPTTFPVTSPDGSFVITGSHINDDNGFLLSPTEMVTARFSSPATFCVTSDNLNTFDGFCMSPAPSAIVQNPLHVVTTNAAGICIMGDGTTGTADASTLIFSNVSYISITGVSGSSDFRIKPDFVFTEELTEFVDGSGNLIYVDGNGNQVALPANAVLCRQGCDIDVSFVGTQATTTVFDDPCQSAFDRVYQIAANCSTSTVTQTVLYVLDDSNPRITALAPFTDFGCAGDQRTLEMSSNAVVAVNAISTNFVMETRITNGCQVTVTRSWRVEDCCGNFDLKPEVYTYTDAPPAPVFVACPSDPLVIGCIASSNQVPATILNATSACAITVSQMDGPHTPVAATCGSWTFDRVFTATDICGATATCIQTIIYTLDIPPVAPTPEAAFTATCVAPDTTPAGLPAPLPGVMVSATVTTNGCDVAMTRTYTTNNCCGISAQASVTHSWTTLPAVPTLTGPSVVQLGCILDAGNIPVPSTSQLTAFSGCTITSIVLSATSATNAPTTCCDEFSFTRTYTAIDNCGQPATFDQTITYTLSEVPEILAVEKGTNLGCQVAGTIPPTNLAAIMVSDCLVPQAEIIYTISSNTGFGANAANIGGGMPSLTNNVDGTFTLSHDPTSGANNAVYIDSTDGGSVSNALGRALTTSDVVTVSGTIDATTINPNANGFEFGLHNGPGFRSNPNLLFQIDDGGNRSGPLATFGTPTPVAFTGNESPGSTEASLQDGFSFTATYDAAGITYTVSDIVTVNEIGAEPVGATSYTFFWPGNAQYLLNFPTLVGNSFAYYSQQRNGAGRDSTISVFNISVTSPATFTNSANFAISDLVMTNGCEVMVMRTYRYENCCGDFDDHTETYTYTETPNLVVTALAKNDLGCIPNASLVPEPNITLVAASSQCAWVDIAFSHETNAVTGTLCATSSVERVYSVTDVCGSNVVVTQSVCWVVAEQPLITSTEPAQDWGCQASDWRPPTNVVATGATGTNITESPVLDASGCTLFLSRVYTVTNCCGGSDTRIINHTWTITPDSPEVDAIASVYIGCIGNVNQIPSPSVALVSASSSCAVVSIDYLRDENPQASLCTQSIDRVYEATDLCGATVTVTQTVSYTLNDSDPLLAVAAGTNFGCTAAAPAIPALWTDVPVALGQTDSNVTVTVTTTGCDRVMTRVYQLVDCCGDTVDGTVTYEWTVTPAVPVISGPATIDLGCIDSTATDIPAPNAVALSVVSDCGAVLSHTGDDIPVTNGCSATITRNWEAVATCNQTGTFVQTISYTLDDEEPKFTSLPPLFDTGCNLPQDVSADIIVLNVSVTDNCDTATSIMLTGSQTSSNNCQRTMTRSYMVMDDCGNGAVATLTHTWTVEPPAPTLTGPAAVSYGCVSDGSLIPPPGGTELGALTSVVTCAGSPVHLFDGPHTPDAAQVCDWSFQRVYRIEDACGQDATFTQIVNYTIQPLPVVITAHPADADFGCDAPVIPVGLDGIVLNTNVGPVVTSTDSFSTNACVVTLVREYFAVDCCGNTDRASTTWTWTESPAPSSIIAPRVDLGCIADAGQVPQPSTSQFNLPVGCGVQVDFVSETPANQIDNCTFLITRTYSVSSECNAPASFDQEIRYTLSTPVRITATEPGQDFGCVTTAPVLPAALTNVVVTGLGTSLTFTETTTTAGCITTLTRDYIATDCCGEFDEASVSFTWETPAAAPVITGPAAIDLGCIADAGQIPVPSTSQFSVNAACGATIAFDSASATSTNGCVSSFTRTFIATGNCSQTASFTQNVSYVLTAAPVTIIDHPADADFGCAAPVIPNDTDGVVLSGNGSTVTATDTLSTNNCIVTLVREYTATDCCANIDRAVSTWTWTFSPAPSAIVAPQLDLGCIAGVGQIPAPSASQFTAPAGCGIAVSFVADTATTMVDDCTFTLTRTYRITSDCNPPVNFGQAITYTLSTPVQITDTEPGETFGCLTAPPVLPPALSNVVVSGTAASLTVTETTVTNGCDVTLTREYLATDCCGQFDRASVVWAWQIPLTAPTLTGPAQIDLGCIDSAGQVPVPSTAQFTATATCGTPTIAMTSSTPATTAGCLTTMTRTYTATDNCGLATDFVQTITYSLENNIPVITAVPANADLGCNGTVPPADWSGVTTTGDVLTSNLTDVVTDNGCGMTLTRTWQVEDCCGNVAQRSTIYAWTADDTAPVLSAAPGVSLGPDALGCNPGLLNLPPVNTSDIQAIDDCGPVPVVLVGDTMTTNGCTGVITRVYSATDACGNSATISQTFTFLSDNTAPTPAIIPASLDLGCNPAASDIPAPDASVYLVASMCGNPVVETNLLTEITTNMDCQVVVTRVYQLTDECGNTGTADQTLTWTIDADAPTASCPADQDLGCNPASIPAANARLVTTTDGCSDVTVAHAGDTVTTNGCAVTLERTYTATDGCGNESDCSHTLTWTTDTELPQLANAPVGTTLACNEPIPAPVLPTATDNCGATVVLAANATNDVNCLRTVQRDYLVSDGCGNRFTHSVIWTVPLDDTAPVLTCPAPSTLAADAVCQAELPDFSDAAATDDCQLTSLVQLPVPGTILELGSHTVSLTATDACGNESRCEFAVTVSGGCTTGITLEKTVYGGHNGEAGCANAVESFANLTGEPITWCFRITNTGSVPLDDVTLTDIDLTPDFVTTLPGLLAPGTSVVVVREDTLSKTFINTASVLGTPINGTADVTDADPAGVMSITVGGVGGTPITGNTAGIRLVKTVAADHDAACPGVKLIGQNVGADITYCFEVTNIGGMDLVDVQVDDPQILSTPLSAGDLAAGQSTMISANAQYPGAIYTNVASAVADVDGLPNVVEVHSEDDDAVVVPPCGCVGGVVFLDLDNDGSAIGDNLAVLGLPNITVELLSGGSVIATTTTDDSGIYSFTDLMAGDYIVRYDPATLPGPFTGMTEQSVTVALGCNCLDDIHLGATPAPTAVELETFKVQPTATGLLFTWTTGFEDDVLGFRVLDGTGQAVSPRLILGGVGEYAVHLADLGADTYTLEEVGNDLSSEGLATVQVIDAAPQGTPTETVTATDGIARFKTQADVTSYLVIGFDAPPTASTATGAVLAGALLEVDGGHAIYLSPAAGLELTVE